MSRLFDKADEIFVAERTLSEALSTPRGRRTVGPHELYRFLTEESEDLERIVTVDLFRNPRLREDLTTLRNRAAWVSIPAAAAASDGALAERSFEGGSLMLEPSQTTGQTYLILKFDHPYPEGVLRLLVMSEDGKTMIRTVSKVDAQGETMIILDQSPKDQEFLALLSDPHTSAAVLAKTT